MPSYNYPLKIYTKKINSTVLNMKCRVFWAGLLHSWSIRFCSYLSASLASILSQILLCFTKSKLSRVKLWNQLCFVLFIIFIYMYWKNKNIYMIIKQYVMKEYILKCLFLWNWNLLPGLIFCLLTFIESSKITSLRDGFNLLFHASSLNWTSKAVKTITYPLI